MSGFTPIPNEDFSGWIYANPLYFRAWCTLYNSANYKDGFFDFKGTPIELRRGELVLSIRNFAEKTGLSTQCLRTFFKKLIKTKKILTKTDQNLTHITICNYDNYRGEQHSTNTVPTQCQHSANTVPTQDQHYPNTITTNKEEITSKHNDINSLNLIPENSQDEFQGTPETDSILTAPKPSKAKRAKAEKPEKTFSPEINKLTGDLAKYFPETVTQTLTKSDKLKWCETVNQLIEIDKYTPAEIKEIVIWARGNLFWRKNFLSIRKLRQKNTTGTTYAVYFSEVMAADKKAAESGQNTPNRNGQQFLTADEKREIKIEKFERACVNVMHELLNEKPNQHNDPNLPY